MDITTAILDYIRHHPGGTSFAELDEHIEGFAGTEAILRGDGNIVYWHNVSEAAAAAVVNLVASGQVELTPCTLLVYLVDGKVPKLPIANRPPKQGYKKPHWLPVTLATPT